MKKIHFNPSNILFVALMILTFQGCGGGSGGSSVSPEVQAAMDDAANVEKTVYFELSSGSIEGLMERMTTTFPEISTLIAGGSSARDAMLALFTGTPSSSSDVKLAIFAYALEQMGDSHSLATLKSFLEDNINGDLYFTPQFVTNAIEMLSGRSGNDDFFYTPVEMRTSSGSANIATLPAKADSASWVSCARAYEFVDENGDTLTYVDENGDTKEAIIVGKVFTSSSITDEESQRLQSEVTSGGGTYVNDDSEFRGSPSTQFNCAGYAFRSLNADSRWRLDPAHTFDVLTRTGLLIEVSESEARAGDKVFYFKDSSATRPVHVAEVSNVQSGIISNTITVRNADNNTGLWEAPINASYFTGSWMPNSAEARYPVRKVYRWADGVEPATAKNTSTTDADDCDAASEGLTATVDITGYSVTFSPTTVAASNKGEYTGSIHLTDVVGIAASQGAGASAAVFAINFDRRQISGAGTRSMNTVSNVFEDYTGSATLVFSSPSITNEDDGSQVAFESTGGSFTLTSWGTSAGDNLIGTYLATVLGSRNVYDAYGNLDTETLTGTISGSFNVEITQ